MEDVIADIHSPHSAVLGSLMDSHPPMQNTVYWCRKESSVHAWTALAKLKYASSYFFGFAISDHVVWCTCVSHKCKRTVLTSLYNVVRTVRLLHVLRGFGLVTRTGWEGGGAMGKGIQGLEAPTGTL